MWELPVHQGVVSTVSTNIDERLVQKQMLCYNCNKPGHKAIGCLERKRIHCYRCKKEGVTTENCPNCNQGNGPKHQPVEVSGANIKNSTPRFQPVLDFILDQCEGDERPYLKVSVFGKPGWEQLKDLKLQLIGEKTKIRVANGDMREFRSCDVPIGLRDKVKLIRVLVVTELSHTLILGANFETMGIVPDLRHNEWHFSAEPQICDMVEHLRDQSVLTPGRGTET
ncbi:hypothetical protein NQ317_015919 [Molorchus minor]|uniref:CCHC-type domain-containing protein n=1 Tax=Molorchus minor TaxID=1323400 RepID=A0ABQ9JIU7_9CUCU|nr:hypothetical protein NQ317_015919 [Molorchus minor]